MGTRVYVAYKIVIELLADPVDLRNYLDRITRMTMATGSRNDSKHQANTEFAAVSVLGCSTSRLRFRDRLPRARKAVRSARLEAELHANLVIKSPFEGGSL